MSTSSHSKQPTHPRVRLNIHSDFSAEPLGTIDNPSFDVAAFAPHVRARELGSEHFLPVKDATLSSFSSRVIPEHWIAKILETDLDAVEASTANAGTFPFVLRPAMLQHHRTVAVLMHFEWAGYEWTGLPLDAAYRVLLGTSVVSGGVVRVSRSTLILAVTRLTDPSGYPLALEIDNLPAYSKHEWRVRVSKAVFSC